MPEVLKWATGRRSGLTDALLSRLRAASACALTAAMAACHPEPAKPPPPPISAHALDVFGMDALTPCDPKNMPDYQTIFRIRLPGDIHDIYGKDRPDKRVKYKTYDTSSDAAGSDINDNRKELDEDSTATYSGIDIADNPYHSDLSDPQKNSGKGLKDKIVRYIVMTDFGSNLALMNIDPDSKKAIHGVLAKGSAFICVDDPKNLSTNPIVGNNGLLYTSFYFKNGNKSTLSTSAFNIVLISMNHATSTPIIIDPKIMNNGY
jgi:hypothetical protein